MEGLREQPFCAEETAFLELRGFLQDGTKVAEWTFARPVMLLVWCEDGTCEVMTRPSGGYTQFAFVLREMANDIERYPGGHIEERKE